MSFGTWLRRQREMREVPLREIAEVTKISVRYLEALEQDRFDILPAPVFAKGFLRQYARYVGLDPDEVVNSFLTARSVTEPEEDDEPEPTQAHRRRTAAPLLTLAVIVILAVAALLVFYGELGRETVTEELPPIAAPPPPPAVVAPPVETEPPAPTSPLVVTMDFTEDCWVEVVVDGERQISELYVQGESMRLEAQERVVLTLGNPSGVRLEVNGRPWSPGVRGDRVARDLIIDLETARQLP